MLTTKIRTAIIALVASASFAGMTAVPAVSQARSSAPELLKVEQPERPNLDCFYGDVAYPLGTKLIVGDEVLTCVGGLPPHWDHTLIVFAPPHLPTDLA